MLLAAVNACAIAAAVPLPGPAAGGVALRLAHHAYDAAETLGVGAIFAVAVGGFVRFARLPRWALAVVAFAAAAALLYFVVGDYLAIMSAHALDGRFTTSLFVGKIICFATLLAGAPVAAAYAADIPVLRWLPVPIAIGVLAVGKLVLHDDYMDIHGVVALGAALFGGGALAPWCERAGRSLARRRAGRVALAALGVFALFGLVHPPPDRVRFELFRQPCAIAPWVLATLEWRAPWARAPVRPPESSWLQDRSGAPARLPTAPALLPPDAVVVLLTIDALRADVVPSATNDARFPTLARLEREGVFFTHASAPGPQTEVSFATVLSGRYYSELLWKDYGSGWLRHVHPAGDPSLRFPELLADHGVTTVNYAGIAFLAAPFGVARGFREETFAAEGKAVAPGSRLVDLLTDRLKHAGGGPMFLWSHLMDAHDPYIPGKEGDSDYERYLASVAVEDELLGRVLGALEKDFGRRWALFVSADHGEAFGEHDGFQHGKTLYEEILHVPLIAVSPLFPARRVDTPVGLVDLGPTLLDLFGVPTPATFDGQSLVAFLAGGSAVLTRPLIAEGRLRRALTQPDGLKVIDDPRRKVVEVYDLTTDPGETTNLFDAEPERSDAALAELRAFFAVHTRRDGGYEPPYKR